MNILISVANLGPWLYWLFEEQTKFAKHIHYQPAPFLKLLLIHTANVNVVGISGAGNQLFQFFIFQLPVDKYVDEKLDYQP